MEDIRRKEKARMRKQKSRALNAQILVGQVKKKKVKNIYDNNVCDIIEIFFVILKYIFLIL